jgi:hypothetical protein
MTRLIRWVGGRWVDEVIRKAWLLERCIPLFCSFAVDIRTSFS